MPQKINTDACRLKMKDFMVGTRFNIDMVGLFFEIFEVNKRVTEESELYPKPLELQLGGEGTQPHELRRTKRLG